MRSVSATSWAPLPLDRELYRLRNRVERLNNKLKQFRAVATRYDKTAASYLAFVQLAASRLWLRFVHTAWHYSCAFGFRWERCAAAWCARRQSDQAMTWAGRMRRCARRTATRRISWTDQRMRSAAAGRAGSGFLGAPARSRGGGWSPAWRRRA